MDDFKNRKTKLRRKLTNYSKDIEELMKKDPVDFDELAVYLEDAEMVHLELEEIGRGINDLMEEDPDVEEAEIDAEEDKALKYRRTFLVLKKKAERILRVAASSEDTGSAAGASNSNSGNFKRGYSLPKLKLKEFNGEYKEWLGFWAQFRRIHEDDSLDISVKFQYLDMAMVKGTRAKDVLDIYPKIDENYPKAIETLKHRFGRDKLQVEVYVRELIKLLIHNVNQKSKMDLSRLYDMLESHLKALESLGVKSETNEAILFPLVESCLPVTVLRAWERSAASKIDGARLTPPQGELQILMEFLRAEVESEQRISLACEGFGTKEVIPEVSNSPKKFAGRFKKHEEGRNPTAAGLVNEVNTPSCVFCSGSHVSDHCGKAKEMPLSEKKDKLRQGGCCFICIRKGCWTKKCDSTVTCYACGKRHHTLLCSEVSPKVNKDKKSNEEKPGKEENTTASTANIASSGEVYLQTAMVQLINGNKKLKVRALFDTGSQRTHIMSSTAQELGLEVKGTETLTHVLFGGAKTEVNHNQYVVTAKTMDSAFTLTMNVLDQDKICNKLPSVPRGSWMSQLRDKGIWLEDIGKGNEEIQMLIGGDVYGDLLTGKIEKLSCGLTAVETKLGWTVMGTLIGAREAPKASHSMVVTSLTVSQLSVPDLWRLETIGIRDPIDLKTSAEEEAEVLCKFEQTVQRDSNGRYIVKLPWRVEVPDLPTNRLVAEKRLHSTTKKLKETGNFDKESLLGTVPESATLPTLGADWNRPEGKKNKFHAYDKVFQEWHAEGIIEEIPEDFSQRCHYLPHRAVFKEESATTKVRPVFDASCKSGRAPSLNDCLEKGPNLIDLIPSVMMRFREDKYGVISDIRKAFLMIEVAEEDRDYLRFLWWESHACEKIKIYRHKRVVFGVNSSPFLLGAVIKHHMALYQDDKKNIAEKTLRSLYVDNVVSSVADVDELRRFREISTEMLKEAEMDLRLWQDSHDVTEDMEERVVPVLGMRWDRFEDVLFCDVPPALIKKEDVTKRKILSLTQQIFDPLGIICPVTIQPKLLLQEAWAQKKGWDEKVEEEAARRFLQWNKGLPALSGIQIPRCFNEGNRDRRGWSLHCFTDASSYAYAAIVFLRCEGSPVSVQMVQAKARVAPLKKSTIPRLELVGCLIGARLMDAVKLALSLEDVPRCYWSDSSTALSWIRRNDNWGTFVGNRVKEILTLSAASEWFHVPGKVNPADLPSRGCSAVELLESRWWEGPSWLKLEPSEWPAEAYVENQDDIKAELKKTVISSVAVTSPVEAPWYLKGRSGYSQLLRRASYVFRFVDQMTKQRKYFGVLTNEELEASEKRIVRVVQQGAFADVKLFKTLGVFKDSEGLLRVKTKLLMRMDFIDFRTPMLLPTSHPFVTELIREFHTRNCHAGAQVLISMLREKFWIVHTRKAVNKVIRSCQRCRRFQAKNVIVEAAVLPEDRVKDASPFEITGVDLAGPLYLRNKKKAWIVLFTCAVFRAVHLEVVTSLDTEHFLQALRRFVSRRGRPHIVYSDNGTNFRGAVNLFRGLDWEKIQKKSDVAPIQWKFSPPSAPWWGGFWERMVRSVKNLLIRVLGKSSVCYEELVTILCDVESVVNHRPLTVMTEDDNDLVALTPAMFLQGVRESGVPEVDAIDMDGMNRRFQYRQELLDQLRSRFRTEYLANLRQNPKDGSTRELKVGDLVLVGEDNKKRLLWGLGKVDGFIGKRIAKVRTSGGNLIRPVRRLFPMELNPADEAQQDEVGVFTRAGRKIQRPQRFQ